MYEYFLSNYTDQKECELFPRGFANAFRYIRDNSPVYLKIGENFPIYMIALVNPLNIRENSHSILSV